MGETRHQRRLHPLAALSAAFGAGLLVATGLLIVDILILSHLTH